MYIKKRIKHFNETHKQLNQLVYANLMIRVQLEESKASLEFLKLDQLIFLY